MNILQNVMRTVIFADNFAHLLKHISTVQIVIQSAMIVVIRGKYRQNISSAQTARLINAIIAVF